MKSFSSNRERRRRKNAQDSTSITYPLNIPSRLSIPLSSLDPEMAGMAALAQDAFALLNLILVILLNLLGNSPRGSRIENRRTRTLSRVVLVGAPDAEVDFRSVLRIDAGNLHSVLGNSVSAARNADLSAGVVKLGFAGVGAVEACFDQSV